MIREELALAAWSNGGGAARRDVREEVLGVRAGGVPEVCNTSPAHTARATGAAPLGPRWGPTRPRLETGRRIPLYDKDSYPSMASHLGWAAPERLEPCRPILLPRSMEAPPSGKSHQSSWIDIRKWIAERQVVWVPGLEKPL